MKTQVIQLEPHDDIISARDKMGWAQTQRVVLVWPHRAPILSRQLDIQLLHRHSQQLGVQVGLVTRNPEVGYYARELGIPVFPTVHKAQTERWIKVRRGRGRFRPRTWDQAGENGGGPALDRLETLRARARPPAASFYRRPGVRLAIFSMGVLAVLGIASVLVPRAEITLSPAQQRQKISFTAQASPLIDTSRISGVIPSHKITVVVEGRDSAETSGESLIPGTSSSGTVRLTNLTAAPITIPPGTLIRTLGEDPVRFATTRSGVVPSGPDQSLSLPVEALTRGTLGNQPANSLVSVEGPLGLQVQVTNPLPTIGGSDLQAAAPTQTDRADLRQTLLESLRATAATEIEGQIFPGDRILTPPELVEILEENFDPPDTQPADRLDLLLRVSFSAQIVKAEDLERLAAAVLDTDLPSGYTGLNETIVIRHLSAPLVLSADEVRWQLQAEREIVTNLTANQAINLVLGAPVGMAGERLEENLKLSTFPVIRMTPTWWPRLPILPFRIQINLQAGNS